MGGGAGGGRRVGGGGLLNCKVDHVAHVLLFDERFDVTMDGFPTVPQQVSHNLQTCVQILPLCNNTIGAACACVSKQQALGP